MRIVGAFWSVAGNRLQLACECGEVFDHAATDVRVTCPACKRLDHLEVIRERHLLARTPARAA